MKLFYTKEDALLEGCARESVLHDKPTELKVVEEWLPVPNEMQFLQQVYLYVISWACPFVAKENVLIASHTATIIECTT